MVTLIDWWKSLALDSQEKIIIALATALLTSIVTFIIPKFVWPTAKKIFIFVIEHIYKMIVGWPLFNWWGLKRYKELLKKHLQVIYSPWSSQKMQMGNIYVPIKVENKYLLPHFNSIRNSEEIIDLVSAISQYKRFVLVGNPGAGKSTALKNIGLGILQDRFLPGENILPVFIELRKFSEENISLKSYMTMVLENYAFPNASEFLGRCLDKGKIFLLLDGLDEVRELNFSKVLTSITEFCEIYYKNRVIITCRTTQYNRQLDEISDSTIALSEFNDIQISTFLRHWQFPQDKSSIELMKSLRERPKLLSICRNPLILTIVTSLYIETDYQLPSSRVDFYITCVDAVLKRWDVARHINRQNKFKSALKESILQNLAWELYISQKHNADIDYIFLVNFVSEILRNRGISDEDSEELVEEIIKNSGLLLFVAPNKLRFAHLTFQEYFAAKYAETNGLVTEVVKHYLNDSSKAWREICLLFAGLSTQSTLLVEELSKRDLILAGYCIVDGALVDLPNAKHVIMTLYQQALLFPDQNEELRLLAELASDPKKIWAEIAYKDLLLLFKEANNINNQEKVLAAFAHVTTLEAVQFLISALKKDETRYTAQIALSSIGDLSFPAIRKVINSATDQKLIISCLEICMNIPSPEAVEIILPMMQNNDKVIQSTAAWTLASLIQDPSVHQALLLIKKNEIRKYLKNSKEISSFAEWVWPFDKSSDSDIANIVASIVIILSSSDLLGIINKYKSQNMIDIKVAIPIVIQLLQQEKSYPYSEKFMIIANSLIIENPTCFLPIDDEITRDDPFEPFQTIKIEKLFHQNTNPNLYQESWKNLELGPKRKPCLIKPQSIGRYLGWTYTLIIISCLIFNCFNSGNQKNLVSISISLLLSLLLAIEYWAKMDHRSFLHSMPKPALAFTGLYGYLNPKYIMPIPPYYSGIIANVIYLILSPIYCGLVFKQFISPIYLIVLCLAILICANGVYFLPERGKRRYMTFSWLSLLQKKRTRTISSWDDITADG